MYSLVRKAGRGSIFSSILSLTTFDSLPYPRVVLLIPSSIPALLMSAALRVNTFVALAADS